MNKCMLKFSEINIAYIKQTNIGNGGYPLRVQLDQFKTVILFVIFHSYFNKEDKNVPVFANVTIYHILLRHTERSTLPQNNLLLLARDSHLYILITAYLVTTYC